MTLSVHDDSQAEFIGSNLCRCGHWKTQHNPDLDCGELMQPEGEPCGCDLFIARGVAGPVIGVPLTAVEIFARMEGD